MSKQAKKNQRHKTHLKVDGRLIQTNKRWSSLCPSARDYIYEHVRAYYGDYLCMETKPKWKTFKAELVNAVYEDAYKRGIHVPFQEFKRHVCAYLGKINRSYALSLIDHRSVDQHTV